MVVSPLPDLTTLSPAQKDALIVLLWEQVASVATRLTALEQRLEPPKTPDNSSVPPSKGQKPNRSDTCKPAGQRKGSLGRKGGGRSLMAEPDQIVSAKAAGCRHCGTALGEADHLLFGRYDKIELPRVRPVVTRVERYAGQCSCFGGTTLAPVPDGMEEGSPFGPSVVAMALYLRFTHAISYQRLHRLFEHLFGLAISGGALDALFRRAKPAFDDATVAILARLRRSRIVCSDETSVRIDGRTCWNWVFQNEQVVIHVMRHSRGAGVVAEVMGGHRPAIWVSDQFCAQQGHADLWQVCLTHQLRDCQFAIDAGDTVFAPCMKALLLRAVLLARRRKTLTGSTPPAGRQPPRPRPRRHHGARPHQPARPASPKALRQGPGRPLHLPDPPRRPARQQRLRARSPADRHLSQVTGGFRSDWGADLFASVRSVVGTAARNGINAYAAIRDTLCGCQSSAPG